MEGGDEVEATTIATVGEKGFDGHLNEDCASSMILVYLKIRREKNKIKQGTMVHVLLRKASTAFLL